MDQIEGHCNLLQAQCLTALSRRLDQFFDVASGLRIGIVKECSSSASSVIDDPQFEAKGRARRASACASDTYRPRKASRDLVGEYPTPHLALEQDIKRAPTQLADVAGSDQIGLRFDW